MRLFHRSKLVWCLVLLFLSALLAGLWIRMDLPAFPKYFTSDIPANCQQLLCMRVQHERSVTGQLWLLERQAGGSWRKYAGPVEVTLGHNGLAWGVGEHTVTKPPGVREKREGDKCSPAGLFRLPFAFGLAEEDPAVKLPYIHLSESIAGVDDTKSKFYNQVVDSKKVAKDWESEEAMRRFGGLYEWGAFIAHNPCAVPGLGSCLFLHVWPGPGRGTAGCTAMFAGDMKMVARWLDPACEPRLMQWVEGW